MTISPRRVSRWLRFAVAAATAAAIASAAAGVLARRSARAVGARSAGPFRVVRTVLGPALTRWAGVGSGCLILRYSSTRCKYCGGSPAWASIASSRAARGSERMLLSPELDDLPLGTAGTTALTLVGMGVVREMSIPSTPTTLVASRDGRILWEKAGRLDAGDPVLAICALQHSCGLDERSASASSRAMQGKGKG